MSDSGESTRNEGRPLLHNSQPWMFLLVTYDGKCTRCLRMALNSRVTELNTIERTSEESATLDN